MSITVALPFFGGELSSFTPSNASVFEDATPQDGIYYPYDTAYARCALHCFGQYALATSPAWSSSATLWCHATVFQSNEYVLTDEVGPVLYLYSGAVVVAQLVMNMAFSSGTLQLQTLQSGSMVNVGSAYTFSTATLYRLDISVTGGASGSAAFYVNESVQASATSLNHTSWAGVTQMAVSGCDSGPAAYYSTDTFWSEIICDSTSTIGRRLITDNFTNESAVYAQWSGFGGASNVADINEIALKDATYIQAPSGGLTDTFYQSGLSLGSFYVLGRGVAVRCRNQGSGGPASIRAAVRTGGSVYVSNAFAMADGFAPVTYMWTVNPSTSSGWSPSAAAAVELGVQSQT